MGALPRTFAGDEDLRHDADCLTSQANEESSPTQGLAIDADSLQQSAFSGTMPSVTGVLRPRMRCRGGRPPETMATNRPPGESGGVSDSSQPTLRTCP